MLKYHILAINCITANGQPTINKPMTLSCGVTLTSHTNLNRNLQNILWQCEICWITVARICTCTNKTISLIYIYTHTHLSHYSILLLLLLFTHSTSSVQVSTHLSHSPKSPRRNFHAHIFFFPATLRHSNRFVAEISRAQNNITLIHSRGRCEVDRIMALLITALSSALTDSSGIAKRMEQRGRSRRELQICGWRII